jgi:hypothetical protein
LRFKNLKLKSSVLPVEIGNVVNLNNAGIRERPIAKYYKNKLICIYSSLIEAGEKTKINSGTICKSCQKGYKAGVFNFKYIK